MSKQDGDKLGRIFPFRVRLRVKTFLPTLWEAESSCGMICRHNQGAQAGVLLNAPQLALSSCWMPLARASP